MRFVPLPELIIVFVIGLLILGPRLLWRFQRPFSFWSRAARHASVASGKEGR